MPKYLSSNVVSSVSESIECESLEKRAADTRQEILVCEELEAMCRHLIDELPRHIDCYAHVESLHAARSRMMQHREHRERMYEELIAKLEKQWPAYKSELSKPEKDMLLEEEAKPKKPKKKKSIFK